MWTTRSTHTNIERTCAASKEIKVGMVLRLSFSKILKVLVYMRTDHEGGLLGAPRRVWPKTVELHPHRGRFCGTRKPNQNNTWMLF